MVLDVLNGRAAKLVWPQLEEATGCDISPSMLEYAQSLSEIPEFKFDTIHFQQHLAFPSHIPPVIYSIVHH